MFAAALLGCPVDDSIPDDLDWEDPTPPAPAHEYPLDDVLRLDHLQAVGTHNSYHVETGETPVTAWDYTHVPLDEQLGVQGVRQFELDLFWDPEAGGFDVLHVPLLDPTTTCETLADCLRAMRSWSERNPAHHPLFTLLEVKDVYDEETAEAYLDDLEATVSAVWPDEALVTPDDLRGDHEDLRTAIEVDGWPTLGELRGRALFVLHDGGSFRHAYTGGSTTTEGRILFPDAQGDTTLSFAAVHSMNDAIGSFDAIGDAVTAGHLVRTRADSDSVQALSGDTERRDAALASGAHFVSTDYPVPRSETGYVVTIPGGTPSRCNPVSAPAECASEDIEDPAAVGP